MAAAKHQFRKNGSRIFFALGLDNPNALNHLTNSDFTHAAIWCLESIEVESASGKIGRILPDGQIDFAAGWIEDIALCESSKRDENDSLDFVFKIECALRCGHVKRS
jgi:hypothetical protein